MLHQANVRILDAAAEQLGIDRSKMFVNLDRYGNTSAGSIPLALDEAMQAGRIRAGRPGAGQRIRRRPDVGHRDHRVVASGPAGRMVGSGISAPPAAWRHRFQQAALQKTHPWLVRQ